MFLRTANRIVTYDVPVDSALNGGGLGPNNSQLRANDDAFQVQIQL